VPETSDAAEELERRARDGETAAIAGFIDLRRLQLLAYISHRLGAGLRKKIEPEDILQEVTLEALRTAKDLKNGPRDLFGWLCQLSEYRLIDAHRRFFGAQKRSAGREVGLDAGGGAGGSENPGLIQFLVASFTTPSQAFSRDQREIQLYAALETLPAEARDALRLRYVENLPTKEIADRLGKSDGAVRVLLSRSLARLQGVLEPPSSH